MRPAAFEQSMVRLDGAEREMALPADGFCVLGVTLTDERERIGAEEVELGRARAGEPELERALAAVQDARAVASARRFDRRPRVGARCSSRLIGSLEVVASGLGRCEAATGSTHTGCTNTQSLHYGRFYTRYFSKTGDTF